MFYGQDQTPKPGTPPPLCFLTGLGDFQFQQHPLAITGFNYTLPTDVDYIRAGKASSGAGVNTSPQVPKSPGDLISAARLLLSAIAPGASSPLRILMQLLLLACNQRPAQHMYRQKCH